MKKIISLILVMIMLLSVFAGCAKKDDEKEFSSENEGSGNVSSETDKGESDAESEVPTETLSEKELIGIPEDIDFGKKEVNLVCWNSERPEFNVDDASLNGDPILDAIHRRNLYTEELLSVKLNFIEILGAGNQTEIVAWCDAVKNMMDDPSTPVDMFGCYSRTAAYATINGLNQDLTPFANLDLSKEWWPKNVQDEFMIGDKLYFITGDISTNVLNQMYCIFYNNMLVKQFGLDNPVKLVNDKEWTIDKWIEMTSNTYQDVDGATGKSEGDVFGAGFQYYHLDCIIQGAGFKLVKSSDEPGEYLKVTDEFYSEKFGSFVDKLAAWTRTDGVYNDYTYQGCTENQFLEGRGVFQIQRAQYGFSIQNTDINYGIVPPPMLDKSQENYITSLGNPYTIYSISRKSPDGERSAAILQTLGYYGKELTTPAIFDVTFKGKFSKGEDAIGMFDLIRDSIGFDLGILYMRELLYICDIPTMDAISKGGLWSNVMSPNKRGLIERMIGRLNSKIDNVVEA